MFLASYSYAVQVLIPLTFQVATGACRAGGKCHSPLTPLNIEGINKFTNFYLQNFVFFVLPLLSIKGGGGWSITTLCVKKRIQYERKVARKWIKTKKKGRIIRHNKIWMKRFASLSHRKDYPILNGVLYMFFSMNIPMKLSLKRK